MAFHYFFELELATERPISRAQHEQVREFLDRLAKLAAEQVLAQPVELALRQDGAYSDQDVGTLQDALLVEALRLSTIGEGDLQEVLDDMVRDITDAISSGVNNGGRAEQLAFLLRYGEREVGVRGELLAALQERNAHNKDDDVSGTD